MDHKVLTLPTLLTKLFRLLPTLPYIVRGLAIVALVRPNHRKSIGWLLEKHAAKRPNQLAVIDQRNSLTYDQLNRKANRYARYFVSRGIHKGDTVAIMMENRVELIAVTLAAIKLGAIASMINTAQRQETLLHSLKVANSRLLVVGSELQLAIDEMLSQLPESLRGNLLWLADSNSDTLHTGHFTDLDSASSHSDDNNLGVTKTLQLKDPCYYIFTSGTTGLPKASVMTNLRWFKCMGGVGIASLRLRPSEVFYVTLPFYHNNALTVAFSAVLGAGATMAIGRKFSASRFWDEIRDFNAAGFIYIGELCRYLLNKPVSPQDRNHHVRVIVGNGLRPEIWHEFRQRFGIDHINEFYGASECNLLFTNALNIEQTAGYCPLPYEIVRYDIDHDEPARDAKGLCIPVAVGETGLLVTAITKRSPFDGYTDKSATNKKIIGNVLTKGDRYFNTGDLVFKQGYRHVAFVDRLGDTFRWKGENVATTEVEAAAGLFDNVAHAIVYGVEIPATEGRAGMAALILKDQELGFDAEGFAHHMKQHLPAYAVPLFVRIQSTEDTTGTFKYKKVDLKKQGYDCSQFDEPAYVLLPGQPLYQPLNDEICQAIREKRFGF